MMRQAQQVSLRANTAGMIRGSFLVPSNVPSGTKQVVFKGESSHSDAKASYVGTRTAQTETVRQLKTVRFERYDPLAQTFTLASTRHLGYVGLYFSHIGQASVRVQIRETSIGMPNQQVLAEAQLEASGLQENERTRFVFAEPVVLQADREYALVVLTNDPEHALQVAKLGEFDQGGSSWVREQPYQAGVLLSSSNAQTWTPHQDTDLRFELGCLRFKNVASANQPERYQRVLQWPLSHLGAEATPVSDLMLSAVVSNSNSQADISFSISDGKRSEPLQPQAISALTESKALDALTLAATITGTAEHSPCLFPDVQLRVGALQQQAVYMSALIAPASPSIQVEFDLEGVPAASQAVTVYLLPFYQQQQQGRLQLSQSASTEQQRYQHQFEADQKPEKIQIALVLQGNPSVRPQVKNLRIFSI